jgi:CRP-like cAMP-binding protein
MSQLISLLRPLPLFRELDDTQLGLLLSVFSLRKLAPGEVLFEAGTPAREALILVAGRVSVKSGSEEVLLAHSPTLLGELAAFTGEVRQLTAVAAEPVEVLAAPVDALQRLLEENGRLGFTLQRNLLRIAVRKIGRDRRRLVEMRQNIIGTQKAMKVMRDALLESEDNPLHASLFEELDALIENNRRIHYLVEPSRLVPTHVRLQSGEVRRVTAISNEWLYFERPPAEVVEGEELPATLVLDAEELPVSGQVTRVTAEEASVYLDELIEPYLVELTRHLTRAQLLDVVL